VQRWFSLRHPGRSPYVLYALFERWIAVGAAGLCGAVRADDVIEGHAAVWAVGFAVYAMLCGLCAMQVWKLPSLPRAMSAGPPSGLRRIRSARALAAAALGGSMLLLAVTNQLCQEVAVVPFCGCCRWDFTCSPSSSVFESDRWYHEAYSGVGGDRDGGRWG